MVIDDLTESHSYDCVRGQFEAKNNSVPKAKAKPRIGKVQAASNDKKNPAKRPRASKQVAAKIKSGAAKPSRQKQGKAAKRMVKSRASVKPRARKMAA